MISEETVSPRM